MKRPKFDIVCLVIFNIIGFVAFVASTIAAAKGYSLLGYFLM